MRWTKVEKRGKAGVSQGAGLMQSVGAHGIWGSLSFLEVLSSAVGLGWKEQLPSRASCSINVLKGKKMVTFVSQSGYFQGLEYLVIAKYD